MSQEKHPTDKTISPNCFSCCLAQNERKSRSRQELDRPEKHIDKVADSSRMRSIAVVNAVCRNIRTEPVVIERPITEKPLLRTAQGTMELPSQFPRTQHPIPKRNLRNTALNHKLGIAGRCSAPTSDDKGGLAECGCRTIRRTGLQLGIHIKTAGTRALIVCNRDKMPPVVLRQARPVNADLHGFLRSAKLIHQGTGRTLIRRLYVADKSGADAAEPPPGP